MDKQQVDELYHLLRVVSNTADISGPLPLEEVNIVRGLTKHLLAGGDYLALVQFSAYYGKTFLLEPTCEAIVKAGWKPHRIVEFGAGLGWLGRGVSGSLGLTPCLFVDKRNWTLIDIIADLETDQGLEEILTVMKDGDLIVAADFLHCLDDPEGVMSQFSKWPMAILEYCPVGKEYAESYSTQIKRYGATPIDPRIFVSMFPGRKVDIVDIDPYILLLVEAEK